MRKRIVREEGIWADKPKSLTSAQSSDVKSKDVLSLFARARARARANKVPLAAVERRERRLK